MCGCALAIRMPAVSARCRRRWVAARRSIREPQVFSRIGPRSREPTARSMARPTAGGSGTRTTSVPLPHTRRTRWLVFLAEIGDVRGGRAGRDDGTAHVLVGRMLQDAIKSAGPVEPGHDREPPGHSGGLESADLLEAG